VRVEAETLPDVLRPFVEVFLDEAPLENVIAADETLGAVVLPRYKADGRGFCERRDSEGTPVAIATRTRRGVVRVELRDNATDEARAAFAELRRAEWDALRESRVAWVGKHLARGRGR